MISRNFDDSVGVTRLLQLSLLAVVALVGCSTHESPASKSTVPESLVEASVSGRPSPQTTPRELAIDDAAPIAIGDPPTTFSEVFAAYQPRERIEPSEPSERIELVAFVEDENEPVPDSDVELLEPSESEESSGDDSTDVEAANEVESSDESEATSESSDNVASNDEGEDPEDGSPKDGEKEPLTFKDWKDPELVFLFTGRQHGYIEPCGCTGLENSEGGLARRHTMLKQLRAQFGEVSAFDVGNQIRRFGRQAELKFQATIDSLETMKYRGVGFGPDDLRIGFGDLLSAVAGSEETPFVCANIALYDFVPTHQVVEIGKRRIGVTAVLGDSYIANINNEEITTTSAEVGLKKAMAALKEKKCELFVLLVHATMDETRELVKKFPEVQIVVTSGGAGVPDLEPERIPGCFAYIIRVGEKGKYGGAVGVFMDRDQPVRYSRIPLRSRFEDSRPMLDRFLAYQNDLKQHGFSELRVRPVPHPYDPARKYVGNAACADCHEHATEVFATSHHSHATESIIKPPNTRSEITRIHDPECVSCHVTGWDAQGYVPYESGYFDTAKSAHLHSNGCENCHGPGSRHVAFENGDLEVDDKDFDRLEQAYRKEMRLTLEEAKTSKCYQCHDIDNSPAFQVDGAFEEFWSQIEHNDE